METYEIEIKSLLNGKDHALQLEQKMRAMDPSFKHRGSHRQLNHYFEGGQLKTLSEKIAPHLPGDKLMRLRDSIGKIKQHSLRSRLADDKTILVIKMAIDDTSSDNGTARLEIESELPLTLDELDRILLDAGFGYQAKWSRERSEYLYKGMNVSIDRNAGYGYLAEFEVVESDPSKTETTKDKIRKHMQDLGVEELPQDRLARMFDHYNKNWQDYYGTEKTFVIY
ncbi:MAG: CYTH domain-containing protein [Acidobacteriaceae bacterium]